MKVSESDIIQGVLSISVTFGFFGVLSYIIRFGVPVNGGEPILVMLGSLGTAWSGIIGYYFGSAIGSKSKDRAIESLSQPRPQQQSE